MEVSFMKMYIKTENRTSYIDDDGICVRPKNTNKKYNENYMNVYIRKIL